MITRRHFPIRLVLLFGVPVAARASVWAVLVFAVYAYTELKFLRIPFLPISTVGTAVAFYVGFKNNASYDRFWEARKIWGGVVNASRTWATSVVSYILPGDDSEGATRLRRELIYRHLAWINALRLQLRRTSRFLDQPSRRTRRRLVRDAQALRNDWTTEICPFLSATELERVSATQNAATQMLVRQGEQLRDLVKDRRLDLFHQIAMMDVVRELYDLQGKCERIKNTPFPRQYAEYSRIFTKVFVFLVPFGLLDVFGDQIDAGLTTLQVVAPVAPMVFCCALVTWVFSTMEAVGDATEDPFERGMADVPMNALCRVIEIDLREMLGETDLPEKEQPQGAVLY
ncbi:MAG: hypothetical protein B7733_13565 [Myxococcales bacterium FL481]|nr:MAG: hypothetical protein B7733_13565 [Myxococcales bacterium FL481]